MSLRYHVQVELPRRRGSWVTVSAHICLADAIQNLTMEGEYNLTQPEADQGHFQRVRLLDNKTGKPIDPSAMSTAEIERASDEELSEAFA